MKMLFILLFTAAGFAETHRFQATEFHNTFSSAHPPVLRIKAGDHVITSTIDAGGTDAAGVRRGQGPNPEIGPFFVEGAEPGDTLVVHLLRLETNRTTGFSTSLLAPYTADPGFLRVEALRDAKNVTWQIDKQKGIAYIDPVEFKGRRIELPLRPMLGCIATAPANKAAIPTSYPDNFGGNMDYNGMGAGATVMLPVFEPGALLFLGDGHARQGDGEVDGTAIETSLDVEFSVELLKREEDQLAPTRKPGLHHGSGELAGAKRSTAARHHGANAMADGGLRIRRARCQPSAWPSNGIRNLERGGPGVHDRRENAEAIPRRTLTAIHWD